MLLFTDDVVVCTENKEDMERNLAVMKVAMKKWEMNIHWGKTTVLMVSRSGGACKIYVEGEEVEQVEKLKYLGVMIDRDGGCDDGLSTELGQQRGQWEL